MQFLRYNNDRNGNWVSKATAIMIQGPLKNSREQNQNIRIFKNKFICLENSHVQNSEDDKINIVSILLEAQ